MIHKNILNNKHLHVIFNRNKECLNNGNKSKIWDKFLMEYIEYRLLKDWPIPCHSISIINHLIFFVKVFSPYKSSALRKNTK